MVAMTDLHGPASLRAAVKLQLRKVMDRRRRDDLQAGVTLSPPDAGAHGLRAAILLREIP
jgi:hypothetical protein